MRTLFALSLLSLFSCSCIGCNKLPAGLPTSYEYSLSAMRYYHVDWYRVETLEDGTVRLLVQHNCEEVLIVRAPEDIFQRIDDLVRKYGLNRLKSNYKTMANIKDGKSWSVSIPYPEAEGVYSGGYHAWPRKGLWEGIEAINGMLQGIADNASEEDILGKVPYKELDK